MPLLRVTADIIIDPTEHSREAEPTPQEVCDTLQGGAKMALEHFPAGEVVDFEILSYADVTEQEANERGWTE